MFCWCITLLTWLLRAPLCPGAWRQSQLCRGWSMDQDIILCFCSYSFDCMGKFSYSQEKVSYLRMYMDIGQLHWCGHWDLGKQSRVRECSLVSSKTVSYQHNLQYIAATDTIKNKLSASTALPVQHQQFLGFCFTVPLQKPPHTHEHVFLIRKCSRKDHLLTKDTFFPSLSGRLTDRF